MKSNLITIVLLGLFSLVISPLNLVRAQGTAFTYQGKLNSSGSPANGSYDLAFTLYTTNVAGSIFAGPVTNSAVVVTNGLFTTVVDFGAGQFVGESNWLAIAVSTNGANSFIALAPRQQVTPAPYAIYAANAGTASNVSGTISTAQLPASPGFSGTVTANAFAGNGANVTNVNAASLNGLTAANFWQAGGNTGTTNGNYLGTTDNQPLEIRVGGLRAGLISPSNGSPNIVLGPTQNVISNTTAGASILGGINNLIGPTSSYSVIGGGSQNVISNSVDHSLIGGGQQNTIQNGLSQGVLVGGYQNSIQYAANQAFVGGGYQNSILNGGIQAVLVGGNNNSVASSAVFLGGGNGNSISASSSQSVLGGGGDNSIASNAGSSVLGGGAFNNITFNAGTSYLGGGSGNKVEGMDSVLVGGVGNIVGQFYAFLGGGEQNSTANGQFATLVGGFDNTIQNSYYAFLGGGLNNTNGANYAFLGGGQFNNVGGNAYWATLGGGYQNTVTANYATVPGGSNNLAGAVNSFAAGTFAQATNSGAFVWSDAEGTPFNSINANSFNVRANGGVRLVTSGAGLSVDGQPVLAGNVSFAQLLGEVVTNNEPAVPLGNLTLAGILNLPPTATIYSGSAILLRLDSGANFFAGQNAGNLTTSGTLNTAVGTLAMPFNTSGSYNAAYGSGALLVNSNGWYNTASGNDALGASTSAFYNTADGSSALALNTTGSNNVAVGANAIANSTTDSGLVAIGYQALMNDAASPGSITIGGANTAVGYESLMSDSSGIANTGLGYQSLFANSTGNNNTAIGTFALAAETGSGNIGIGSLAGFSLTTGSANIDIGNQGVGGDTGVIRIGDVQTETYLAGTVNCSSLFSTNISGNFGDFGTLTSDSFSVIGGNVICASVFTGGSINCVSITSGPSTCSTLTITGGSDLAEPFPFSQGQDAVPEGSVVVIDQANPGHLKLSDQPYDAGVARVVSGANGIHPGIQMQQRGALEGGKNVALSGRVYVLADASNGPIKPSDMLTTSSTPGYAMRVTDHTRAAGAVLGKAMTGLSAGKGLVLVLVTLQ